MHMKYLFLLLCVLMMLPQHVVRADAAVSLDTFVSRQTRLMVFSPHPDDETLAAAGLIQRVQRLGGRVKVVFMTNGDGFPDGVQMEDHISTPTPNDYVGYGNERRLEAEEALKILGIDEEDILFLGFPDGGLYSLLTKFRQDPQVYTSPYTKETRPPLEDMIVPHTDYNGSDLRQAIERILTECKPNLIALPHPADQHPDHGATFHFVKEALSEVKKKNKNYAPRVVMFLIHFGQWPVGQGSGTGSRLNPPEGFPDKDSRWVSLPLKEQEAKNKLTAILSYHTQMLVMGRFLLSFARANELFLLAP